MHFSNGAFQNNRTNYSYSVSIIERVNQANVKRPLCKKNENA